MGKKIIIKQKKKKLVIKFIKENAICITQLRYLYKESDAKIKNFRQ